MLSNNFSPSRSVRVLGALILAGAIACGNVEGSSGTDRKAAFRTLAPADTFLGFHAIGKFQPPPEGGFWALIDLAISPEGVWAVDMKAAQMHLYSFTGEHQAQFARAGNGPGELAQPFAIGWIADTVWVLNTANSRIEYFSPRGEYLSSQPLPDGATGLVHMVAIGTDFVATRLFGGFAGGDPFVRFPRRSNGESDGVTVRGFGAELGRHAEQVAGEATNVPPVYRLARVDGELWALHTYLPLVGIFSAEGDFIRALTYPAPPLAAGRMRTSDDGQSRTLVAPPNPGGTTDVLPGAHGEVYLLSQQQDRSGNQLVYRVGPDRSRVSGPLVNRSGQQWGLAAVSRGRAYVLATDSETGEQRVLVLERSES